MKKFLFAFFALMILFATSVSAANWVFVANVDGVSTYYDADTIETTKAGKRLITIKQSPSSPTEYVVVRTAFKCSFPRSFMPVHFTTYSLSTGEETDSWYDTKFEYRLVVIGTINDFIGDRACN